MVKNLINLTYGNRKKIAEMCEVLLPKVGYARVTHSGIVILKKTWWSLKRKKIPITDIIIKYLPIEIGRLLIKAKDRAVYVELFNYRVATIVSLTKYTPHFDLFAYVYDEYTKACFSVDPEYRVVIDYQEPIPNKIQNYSIKPSLDNITVNKNKYKLSKRIQKLKERIQENPIISIINLRLITN